MRTLTLKEALAEAFDPEGRTVVDVGCGDGGLVRHFTTLGARAIGVEVSAGQLARALNAPPVGAERYEVASGESLPFKDASVDALVFSNSFHHLPAAVMAPALVEAARVLRPDGRLVVVEPIASGPFFDVVRLIEDETEVRGLAYETLRRPPPGLELVEEMEYVAPRPFRDVEQMIAYVVAVDPVRRAKLAAVEPDMRARFAANARREGDGFMFDNPMRRHIFRRAS